MIGRDQPELTPEQLKTGRRAIAVESVAGHGRVVEVDLKVESTGRTYVECVSAHRPVGDVGGDIGEVQHLVGLELKPGN